MILLPGPPNELIPMFHQDIFPYLNRLQPETIYSVMVKLCGVGEPGRDRDSRSDRGTGKIQRLPLTPKQAKSICV